MSGLSPLRELLPQRRVRPLRLAANGLILLLATVPPLICVGSCFVEQPELGIALTGGALGLSLSARLAAGWRHRRAQATLAREHQDALAALLAAHKLAHDDRGERAEALRAEFWRARQREAVADLQRRAQHISPDLDLVDALRGVPRGYAVMAACVCGGGLMMGLFILGHGNALDDLGAASACVGVNLLFCLYILTAHSWSGVLAAREQRRELDREVRRVEDLAALAGGLSLADDELEAIWRGALSADVAQGGELEEVTRGEG